MREGSARRPGGVRNRRIVYLDGVRGILALLVCTSHIYGSSTNWRQHRPLLGAEYAVVAFFILSGLVLTTYLRNDPSVTYLKFINLRFWRLWPLLFFTTLGMFLVYQNDYARGLYIPSKNSISLISLIKSVSFLADTGVIKNANSINPPAWSIGLEFWVSAFLVYFFINKNIYINSYFFII